ncbi:embryonic polarity protein dorsal-like isoform X2 [Eupeodes corollae]|nr:embryonic polarity protein dorsal-like isoform X2 [Eupeodes corollae]XP_055917883.1 embryonic polarity protein dorsal-like isoform X2 [Eupeodes corollae]XP_055917884.1 embryonic polarity protein dorsal-like isoform X2 [Eupeodes corollae]XP_055917885.1 embryonic polarity protein dorsal-like isoform X2 [Eupeodes corollae]
MLENNDGINGTMGGPGVQNIDPNQPSTSNFNGNGLIQQQQQQQQPQQQQQSAQQQQQQPNNKKLKRTAYVKITEQPAWKALRFRYECEGRSAGSIPGVNSTPENKTFPTIEIVGYKGRAVVVVSCVTKDQPYRPHPHNLVGKEGCKKGVCTLEINSETMRAVFSNLGIQCVKKRDIEAALIAREDIRVDPFKTGFSHKNQPGNIDLNAVRLCFQVFLEGDQKGRFTVPLLPVVSDPIFDKKALSDLVICRLCSCSSTVDGGKEIILLCEKVVKEDISVRFFEEQNGNLVWEAFGDFQHQDVHKQTAIIFKTPRYRTVQTNEIVKAFIQLRRPSDGAVSEPLPFEFLPISSGRRAFWAIRKNLKRKADMGVFQQILNEDKAAILAAKQAIPSYSEVGCQSDVINLDTPTEEDHTKSFETEDEESVKRRMEKEVDSIIDEKLKEMELREPETEPELELEPAPEPDPEPQQRYQSVQTQTQDSLEDIEDESIQEDISEPRKLSANDKITDWLKSNDEFERTDDSDSPPVNGHHVTTLTTSTVVTSEEDKTLNDLLDHSEELEEIYSDNKLRIETFNNTLINELASSSVDGSLTKSSISKMEVEESFDDAATYTSLEMAFKNPYPMAGRGISGMSGMSGMAGLTGMSGMTGVMRLPAERVANHDPVEIIVNPPAALLNMPSPTGNRLSFVGDENCPPLPPKRIRKQDIPINPPARSSPTSPARPPSQIIIMKTPDQSPPTKKLPPTPNNNNNMSRQKKPGFFSKLFSRRKSKSDLSQTSSSPGSKTASPMGSREPSVAHFSLNDINRSSVRSLKSIQPSSISASNSPTNGAKSGRTVGGKPVGRSVSSVSGKRPHLTAEVIHIPLKGDSSNSLPMHEAYSDASTVTLSNMLDRKTVSAMQLVDIPINDGNMELVAIADRQSLKNLCEGQYGVALHPDVDLTEAEHFALYTSVPPNATMSEFDETSCYYAPVDAGEILTPEEVAKRLTEANKIN